MVEIFPEVWSLCYSNCSDWDMRENLQKAKGSSKLPHTEPNCSSCQELPKKLQQNEVEVRVGGGQEKCWTGI